MANRRMFSNRIANSAKFLQMPTDSQLLYFHMVMRADDDGIVECYPLMRLLGVASDNFKVLLAKDYIRPLNEDQVIVVVDWLEHNTIRADRKINSIHHHLLKEKAPDVPTIAPKPRSDVEDNSKRIGGPSTDGISKVKLSKVNTIYGEHKNVHLSVEEYKKLCTAYGTGTTTKLVEDLSTYLESKGKKYKSHYATIRSWARRKGIVEAQPVEIKSLPEKPLSPAEQEKIRIRMQNISSQFKK